MLVDRAGDTGDAEERFNVDSDANNDSRLPRYGLDLSLVKEKRKMFYVTAGRGDDLAGVRLTMKGKTVQLKILVIRLKDSQVQLRREQATSQV